MPRRRPANPTAPPRTPKPPAFHARADLWLGLGIALLAAIAFSAIPQLGFLKWDDNLYVTDNRFVSRGLTTEGLGWALTASHANNWHPLTWVSHMLDVQLFGMNAGAHHTVNLLFHIAAAVLLFLALRSLTGATGRSAFVAAVFAVHPAHVESVAWLSERKDVLSATLWMATLLAYAGYAHRPTPARYAVVLAAFAAGLAAKPMLVTLPFVLILLDLWPLGRAGRLDDGGPPWPRIAAAAPRLVAEKIPLFALAAASAVTTFVVQQKTGAVAGLEDLSPWMRFANPFVSYVAYVGKLVWPAGLAAFYPYPESIPSWEWAGALALLAAATIVALRALPRRPWLAIGWLWFAGTLVPVIGWVQVGRQAMADRYTYLPFIGLLVMIAWEAHDRLASRRDRNLVLAAAAAGVLLACTLATRAAVPAWRDGVTLWMRALAVTRENAFAHFNLGVTLAGRGETAAALDQYRKALAIDPRMAQAHNNAGVALMELGRPAEALERFTTALKLAPRYPEAHHNLGRAYALVDRPADAMREYEAALADDPAYANAHVEIGLQFARQGRIDEAIARYGEALRLRPDHAAAHNNLGTALERAGRLEEAVEQYQAAVHFNPGFAVAYYNLGAALGRLGRDDAAIPYYAEALRLRPDYADAHNNLGVSLASLGRIAEAVPRFEEALRLRPDFADARRNLDSARVMLGQDGGNRR